MSAWPEYVTDILGEEHCAALAYRTPAAGVAMTPGVWQRLPDVPQSSPEAGS